jgi:hypothetical protein
MTLSLPETKIISKTVLSTSSVLTISMEMRMHMDAVLIVVALRVVRLG